MSVLIQLLSLCMLAAVMLTLWGVVFGLKARQFGRTANDRVVATSRRSVHLQGHAALPLEPGVLLNTLWAHLPNAECQSGECGGCKLRLLEGGVRWIREPVTSVDKSCEILACSCVVESGGDLKCALPS